MSEIYFEKIEISNFRRFQTGSPVLDLSVPDGVNEGSGLTILVGENGTGKTTVLEAIDLLTRNLFSARNRVGVSDFVNLEENVEIKGYTKEDFEAKRLWGNNSFESSGFRFYAKLRDRDTTNRLVDPVVVDNEFIKSESSQVSIQEVEKRLSATGPYGAERVPVRIFYFDKNRSRHLSHGTYQTKFDDVMSDLNYQLMKWLMVQEPDEREKIASDVAQQFQEVHDKTTDKVVEEALEKIEEFVGHHDLKLDIGNLLEPYTDARVVAREDGSLTQIPVNKMGSGIETVASLIFLETIFGKSGEEAMYLIDEPELHLHPQLQQKLFSYLLELSKKRQIVISTHSPYFFDVERLSNLRKFSGKTGVPKISQASPDVLRSASENRNFFDRHRNLLFTDYAIFLEGPDDMERYTNFANQNGFNDMVSHFYMMNGVDHVRFFEQFCESFEVTFAAIVDQDFSYNRSFWDRQRSRRLLNRIKRDFDAFDLDGFLETNANQAANPKSGNDAPQEISHEGTSIIRAQLGNIFVLAKGEVTDYLNSDGAPVSDEHRQELAAIFSNIKEVFSESDSD